LIPESKFTPLPWIANSTLGNLSCPDWETSATGSTALRELSVARLVAQASDRSVTLSASIEVRISIDALLPTGTGADNFARWIDDPELTVVDLAPRPETGAINSLGNTSIAGVAGALAGVR